MISNVGKKRKEKKLKFEKGKGDLRMKKEKDWRGSNSQTDMSTVEV